MVYLVIIKQIYITLDIKEKVGESMFGIIALFDDQLNKRILNLWQELNDEYISSYAFEVNDRKPHITIASYSKLDIDAFIYSLDSYLQDKKSIELSFPSIGSFTGSGTLFYAPVMTDELFSFHEDYHTHFKDFHDSQSLYNPGHWIPHCTIANRLSIEKLLEAFRFCTSKKLTMIGQIQEIAVIDASSKTEAPVIFSKKLQPI